MYKCKICGKEKQTYREMHGHMMFAHREEYLKHKRADGKLDMMAICEKIELLGHGDPKPAGFRYLDRNIAEEKEAISFGFMFIDEEGYCYTEDEVIEEGWI